MAPADLHHLALGCVGLQASPGVVVDFDPSAGHVRRVRVRAETDGGVLTLLLEPTVAGRAAWMRNPAIQLTYAPLPDGRNPWQVPGVERLLRLVQHAFTQAEAPCRALADHLHEERQTPQAVPPATPPWHRLVGLYHDSDLQPVEEDMFAAAWQSGLLAEVVGKEPATAHTLSARLELEPDACVALLRCLASLGLVTPIAADRWGPTESGRELVNHRAAVVEFRMRTRERWSRLGALAQGRAPRRDLEAADWNALAEMWAMRSDADEPRIAAYVAKLDLGHASHLLDLGSGAGLWATAMLRAFAQLRVTLVDYPPALTVAAGKLAREGLLPRATLTAAEFFAPDWEPPGDVDVVWFANTLHATSYAVNASLLARVFLAMPRGGQLYLVERVASPMSREACRSEMAWMIYSEAGRGYTFEEMRQLVQGAGFAIEREDIAAEGSSLLLARKP